ncbi:MAG: winged helix-turn-helix transcriptional regulator [Oscillospiraceae bacterium]|nr:winged helix-turn-helix transcriptional regulator [Oscillospiraceae bacterium]
MAKAEQALFCGCEVIHEDAVAEVRDRMANAEDYTQLASLLKLFGDPTRVRLLHALELRELCVCDLAALLGVTKSAVSHQLKMLRLSNLVKFRREGQVVYYSLADGHVRAILEMGFEHIRE